MSTEETLLREVLQLRFWLMFDNCKIGQGHSVALVEDSVGVDRRGIRRKACIVNISLAFFCSCFQHKSYSNPRDAAQAMCDIAIHSDVSVSRAAVWGQRQSVVLRWQWISGIWRPVISHLAEPTCGTIWFTYNLSPTAKLYAAWCCMALHGSGEGQVLNISEMPYGRRHLSHVCQHKRCGREGLLPRATDTDKTWRSNWPINNLWLWQSLNLHFWTFLVDWPETFKDLKTAFKNEKNTAVRSGLRPSKAPTVRTILELW